jgi:hypothetical protein
MRGRRIIWAAALAAALSGAPQAATQTQSTKPEHLVEHVEKGGFSPRDRQIAAVFLARRRADLPEAPPQAEIQVAAGVWTQDLARFGHEVPKRLERELSPAAQGTVRVLFNRTLLLVRSADGRVLDRVFPDPAGST